jgi:hypothetical protein
MSLISSPELFRNIKRIPDKLSKEYVPFFEEEKRKIKEGVTINGVFIPAWLYWHINHWSIDIDVENPVTKEVERKPSLPHLRDNEWLLGNAVYNSERSKKGLLILGCRQLGKSEFGSSYLARRAIAYANSQNVVAGLSEPDLNLLTSKTDRGFGRLHPFFRPIKILNNWKSEVKLGYKDKQGERYIYSEILIRNLDGGKNTENLAGPTTSSLLLDEVGKNEFIEAFAASRPALETSFGWRCSPIFMGTSGSFEKSKDLEIFYSKLANYNFDHVVTKDEKDRTVHFIPGIQASSMPRKKIRLSTFLGASKGSELDITPIYVVDKDAAYKKVLEKRQSYLDAKDYVNYKKEVMYSAMTEEELFMIDDKDNPFIDIIDLAKDHLAYLESIDSYEEYGFMSKDPQTNKVIFKKTSNKFPIQNFPTGEDEDKDAPIVIYDHPIPGQEFGILHVAGGDPYNQDDSHYSPSLGTIYIFRRVYDPLKGKFQNMIVASYAARPRNITRWQEQVRYLLEYYDATILPENEEASFIRYFDEKNIGFYIEDGIDLAKEINPNTKVNRRKGLAATTPNIRYGNGLLKTYCAEEIIVGQDPNGNPIVKPGIVRIKDKLLLKEIIAYKPGKNVDRIVAFRHALILANSKDKYAPVAKVRVVTENVDKPKKKPVKSPFYSGTSEVFNKTKSPFYRR